MAPPSKAGFTDLCTNIRIEQPNSDSNEFKGKVVLRAVLKSDGTTTTLELDEVLASRRGKLCWRERGDFSKKLYRGTLPRLVRHLDWVDTDNDGEPDKRMYTVMHAQMQLPDGNFVESSVNLDDHIAVGDVIAAGQTDDKSATLPQGLVPFKLPRARTVVLCFDGTSNKFDDTVSSQRSIYVDTFLLIDRRTQMSCISCAPSKSVTLMPSRYTIRYVNSIQFPPSPSLSCHCPGRYWNVHRPGRLGRRHGHRF